MNIRESAWLKKHKYRDHIIAKYEEWLDNTDINNLGILKWANECLPEYMTHKTPEFHMVLYAKILGLYNPKLRNKYERQLGLISYRESAKSTVANMILASYVIAMNGQTMKITVDFPVKNEETDEYELVPEVVECKIDEKLIVIISETSTSAEDFTVRIRDEFLENPTLRYYFAFQIQTAIDAQTGQMRRTAFLINGTYVLARGTGQQIRGKIKGASRPTLIIADDLYSENNTVTEERRESIRKWWKRSVINSVDSVKGKIVLMGTIVHDDTILVSIKDNPQWDVIVQELMPIDNLHRFIENHLDIDWETMNCRLPYADELNKLKRQDLMYAHFKEIQESEDWQLSWPERIDLYYIALKFADAVQERDVDGFYQEYFHITVSPEERKFKKEYFQSAGKYKFKHMEGYNWIYWEDQWQVVNIELGVDTKHGGTSDKSDDAAIVVSAHLRDQRRIVLNTFFGRWPNLRDDLYGDTAKDLRLDKVTLDRGSVKRTGIIDETFRVALEYHASKIKVGTAPGEKHILAEFRRVFEANEFFINIIARPQNRGMGKEGEEKQRRIVNGAAVYYETRMVYHGANTTKLEYQLEYLGKASHDDIADALEISFYQLDMPDEVEYEEFQEEDEEALPSHRKRPRELIEESTWDWRTN